MNEIYIKHISELYNRGKDIVTSWRNNEWKKPELWIVLGKTLAEIIDNVKDIKGEEKKDIVIQIIIQLISDENIIKNIDNNIRERIITVINIALPTTLDLIIEATKGNININKKLKKFNCFNC